MNGLLNLKADTFNASEEQMSDDYRASDCFKGKGYTIVEIEIEGEGYSLDKTFDV